ncbi:hypothetical protein [Burkholderia pseudomallei]|uniref:hypothetical protein n=1 Tax=Burkholderia pseudomallei TaxID=28450 RepID=UPI000977A523|nr:hypothetical protein [Burkholderia pseudomallei]
MSADSTRTTQASADDRTGHARKTVRARGTPGLVAERSVLDGRRATRARRRAARDAPRCCGDGPSPQRIGNGISDYFGQSKVQFAFKLSQIISYIEIKTAPRARIHPGQEGNPIEFPNLFFGIYIIKFINATYIIFPDDIYNASNQHCGFRIS